MDPIVIILAIIAVVVLGRAIVCAVYAAANEPKQARMDSFVRR